MEKMQARPVCPINVQGPFDLWTVAELIRLCELKLRYEGAQHITVLIQPHFPSETSKQFCDKRSLMSNARKAREGTVPSDAPAQRSPLHAKAALPQGRQPFRGEGFGPPLIDNNAPSPVTPPRRPVTRRIPQVSGDGSSPEGPLDKAGAGGNPASADEPGSLKTPEVNSIPVVKFKEFPLGSEEVDFTTLMVSNPVLPPKSSRNFFLRRRRSRTGEGSLAQLPSESTSKEIGVQSELNRVGGYLEGLGMGLAARKSLAFRIDFVPRARVTTNPRIHVRGKRCPQLNRAPSFRTWEYNLL